ncbi:hypothetical protein U0070_016627 [Myodes glareolus]|uniref:Uncharacterized protein n=1 Tax=Myodes glareolus TaxID=447135 RepID=A0AAW0HWN1_MYOGA
MGRNPFFLEPAIIITITDGSKLTTTSGVQDECSAKGAAQWFSRSAKVHTDCLMMAGASGRVMIPGYRIDLILDVTSSSQIVGKSLV